MHMVRNRASFDRVFRVFLVTAQKFLYSRTTYRHTNENNSMFLLGREIIPSYFFVTGVKNNSVRIVFLVGEESGFV